MIWTTGARGTELPPPFLTFCLHNVNNTKLKDTNNIQINDCYKNNKGETLGLNKKSVNHASLSERGRHPLHYDIVKRLLKYCY